MLLKKVWKVDNTTLFNNTFVVSVLYYKTQCHIAYGFTFFKLISPLSFFFFRFYSTTSCFKKLVSAKLEKKNDRLRPASSFLTPQIITASLLDCFARSSSNPNFPGYLCVLCWRLPQCWHPSSKFPSWRPPLAPICLPLTSSVPSFPQHAFCPGVRPHPLSPVYSSLSNSSPNT